MRTFQATIFLATALFVLPAMAAEPIPLSEVSHIHGVSFDPATPGSLFLATHHGLYRASPDGTAFAVSENADDYMGFAPHPSDPALLFASGHPVGGGNSGVIVSRDRGLTWAQISTGMASQVDFHTLSFSRADPRTVYGLSDGIQVSRDGGVTWTKTGPGPEKVVDLAASAGKVEIVYAATLNGLLMSSDTGRTWLQVGPPDVQVSMVEAVPDGSLYAFFVGSGLFRKSPADGIWTEPGSDLSDKIVVHFAADPTNAMYLVAVTDSSEILRTVDGGKTWTKFGQ